MGTKVRAELSKKNKYYISKHRYYELKHFCLQYYEWKDTYRRLHNYISPIVGMTGEYDDPTGELATKLAECSLKMKMVHDCAYETDQDLAEYLVISVTEGVSYTYLRTVKNIPCSRDVYYELYRKFFYILSNRNVSV